MVVVLPLVPVTPTATRRSPGRVVRPRGDRSGDRARVVGDQHGDPSGQAGVLQQRGAGLVREDRHGAGVDRLRGVRGAVHL